MFALGARAMAASERDPLVDRMITFSDGVFAVALTLLALELRPPDGVDGAAFWGQMLGRMPQIASLLISFALASLWWLVHMAAMRELRTFDWPTAICNLVFLFFIVLLPFAGATFASNVQGEAPLALYWMINAGASFAMTLTFLVMSRGRGRLLGGVGSGERALRLFQAIAPGIVFALGAYWAMNGQIWWSRFCCVLLAPLMMSVGVMERWLVKRRRSLKQAS